MKGAIIGTIIPWSGPLSQIPNGWIICDGSTLKADDYPLLVQAIGDTYNQGDSTLGGGFPAYTGEFVIPNLLEGKALMDMESAYFATGGRTVNITSVVNGQTVGVDADPTAGNIIQPFIGENTDNGINVVFNDVRTDVEFTLNDRDDYGGNITGNVIIPGQGEKSIFIGGRKLGHQHIRSHGHPGVYDTLASPASTRPGLGVVPYDNITARFTYAAIDEATSTVGSDGRVDELRLGLTWYKDDLQLEDESTLADSKMGSFSGFGSGQDGRVVAQINSERPPVNLSAKNLTDTPLAVWGEWRPFDYTPTSGQPRIEPGDEIPFALFGGDINMPQTYRNYYLDETSGANYATAVSNEANEWLDGEAFLAHVHDPFSLIYNQNSLKPQPRLEATFNVPGTTELDNVSNAGALEIVMNTSQPSVTCVYIIRAY